MLCVGTALETVRAVPRLCPDLFPIPYINATCNSIYLQTIYGIYDAYIRNLNEPVCTYMQYMLHMQHVAVPQYSRSHTHSHSHSHSYAYVRLLIASACLNAFLVFIELVACCAPRSLSHYGFAPECNIALWLISIGLTGPGPGSI